MRFPRSPSAKLFVKCLPRCYGKSYLKLDEWMNWVAKNKQNVLPELNLRTEWSEWRWMTESKDKNITFHRSVRGWTGGCERIVAWNTCKRNLTRSSFLSSHELTSGVARWNNEKFSQIIFDITLIHVQATWHSYNSSKSSWLDKASSLFNVTQPPQKNIFAYALPCIDARKIMRVDNYLGLWCNHWKYQHMKTRRLLMYREVLCDFKRSDDGHDKDVDLRLHENFLR